MRFSPALWVLVFAASSCTPAAQPAATPSTTPASSAPAGAVEQAPGQPGGVTAPAVPVATGTAAASQAAGDSGAHATPIADQYKDAAQKILALADGRRGAWQKLEFLADRIGNRMIGSAALTRAIDWAAKTLKADGQESVHTEKIMVRHWVRGAESAELVAPVHARIAILGLGGTIATPRRGVTADVVMVRDFDELTRLGKPGVKGKIVLFNHPMHPYTEEAGPGYGEAVEYRNHGPARAAALGAVAALVRSVTARSLRTPHTGYTGFPAGARHIPAAAVSTEDTDRIARLLDAGQKVRVTLKLSGKDHGLVPSANVIGELRGSTSPDEVVVIGAHIDSWDVGEGAEDDGAGCAIMMEALSLLRTAGLTPRRTVRLVLFTDEETGGRGAVGYAEAHKAEMGKHVLGIEADTGGFAPRGFEVAGDDKALASARDIVSLLSPIGGNHAREGFAGADVDVIGKAGAPILGLWMDESRYFDYHHSEADTLDKLRPEDLERDAAAVAIMAYIAADLPDRLGGGPPPDAGEE